MAKIKVTNAVGTTENGVNQIERYFKEKYKYYIPSSCRCAICGKKIVRQNRQSSNIVYKQDDIMVGGHLKDRKGNLYLAPICWKCNNQKEQLGEVDVDVQDLLPIQFSSFRIYIYISKIQFTKIIISYIVGVYIAYCEFPIISTIPLITSIV